MENIYFLLLILFIQTISQVNIRIKDNPIFLTVHENPFVLSTTDDPDYYYVITKGINLKINKKSGDICNQSDNSFTSSNYIYFFDNSNNNYIYYSNEYYKINYNPFISYEKFEINLDKKVNSNNDNNSGNKRALPGLSSGGAPSISGPNNEDSSGSQTKQPIDLNNINIIGFISKDNNFIIYGYENNNFLVFLNKARESMAKFKIEKINDKLSCKLIRDENFICAMIINSRISIYCLKYQISSDESSNDYLQSYKIMSNTELNNYSAKDIFFFWFVWYW